MSEYMCPTMVNAFATGNLFFFRQIYLNLVWGGILGVLKWKKEEPGAPVVGRSVTYTVRSCMLLSATKSENGQTRSVVFHH